MTNTQHKLYSVHWWMSFTVTHTIMWTVREGGGWVKAVIGYCHCGG